MFFLLTQIFISVLKCFLWLFLVLCWIFSKLNFELNCTSTFQICSNFLPSFLPLKGRWYKLSDIVKTLFDNFHYKILDLWGRLWASLISLRFKNWMLELWFVLMLLDSSALGCLIPLHGISNMLEFKMCCLQKEGNQIPLTCAIICGSISNKLLILIRFRTGLNLER